MSFYQTRVVDMTGDPFATFQTGGQEDVSVEEITDALNEPGLARVRVPVHHPDADEFRALTREMQVFRDGRLAHWGPLVQWDYADSAVVWSSPGIPWYLTRRVFGPISINFLSNPNFETDMDDWDDGGAGASQSTAVRVRGPGTLRLESGSSGDFYRSQTFLVSTGSIGLFLTAAAWFWIDPSETFEAPAEESRGLYIGAEHSVTTDSLGYEYEPITMAADVGKWTRVEVGIHLNADLVDEPVEVRLYSPWGVIHWGATSVTEQESVSSEPEGTDITEMMRRIVDYAQHGTGKSDLNVDTDTPAAGITETTAYQFFDLGNVFDALKTYPARGLADFAVAVDAEPDSDTGTRTFTTYAPRRGSLKSDHPVTVPGNGVLILRDGGDGQQTSTRVIRRGAGEGSDRELGVAADTSELGGLVLEDVQDAPPETTIDALDQIAAVDLERLKQPVEIPDVEVPAEGWWGEVEPGDTVPLTINWGAIQVNENRRIIAITLVPRTDTVRLRFNVDAG